MTRFYVFLILILSLSLSLDFSFAQEIKSREQLQAELKDLEAQIAAHKKNIQDKQQQGVSLSSDISVLSERIKQSQAQIKAHDRAITRLNQSITEKDRTISGLNEKAEREKDSLAQILRKTNYQDGYSLLDFSLSSHSLSNFFSDSDSFKTLQKALNQSFEDIRITKSDIESVRTELVEAKLEEVEVRKANLLEKKKVENNQAEKKELLTITKGQEANYKKILADREKQAGKIRAALFELSGTKAINFGQAYDLSLIAKKLTGIRPAFLLGLITVESNLGQNVGKGNWKVDMHPTRDQPVFKEICEKLGLNPDTMPVSKKQWYGYGGAMGPAQFIPSTWILYEKRVTKLTGRAYANPWNPEDAFIAAALYLTDNGAAYGSRAKEHRAAMCYLAGCGNANKKSLQFYGNDVLSYADKYESQIKILQGN